MIETIVNEMVKGNFSFAILVVGIIQVVLMWRNGRSGDKRQEINGYGDNADQGE